MIDLEKVIKGLECCMSEQICKGCPYKEKDECEDGGYYYSKAIEDAIELMKEQEKEIKALHLLVEWAEECDFGFDQFPDEYELYKDEIKDMKYIDGMIHIAKRTLEDHGAFEEGR